MDYLLSNLIPATAINPGPTYAVQVRSIGSGKISEWSPVFKFTIAADTTPPVKVPSTPTVTTRVGDMNVAWDGLDNAAGQMDPDFDRVEIHVKSNDNSAWTTDATTYRGYLTHKGSYPVSDLAYGPTWYARLVPVDKSGNKGTGSATSSGVIIQGAGTPVIGPGDITHTMIGNDAIWSPQILAGEVKTNNIGAGEVRANNILAGAITTDKIQAGQVSTDKLSIGTVSTNRVANPMFEEFNTLPSTGQLPPDGVYIQSTSIHTRAWTLSLTTGSTDQAETHVGLGTVTVGSHGVPAMAMNGRCKVMMPCSSLTKGSTIKSDNISTWVNEKLMVGGSFYTNGFTVAAATTAALPTYTTAGDGVLTASASGILTIDDITFPFAATSSNVDSVLIKNENAAPARNGIYKVTHGGSATDKWILTRHEDWQYTGDFSTTYLRPVYVSSGTVNSTDANLLEWYCSTVATPETSPITWTSKEVPKVKLSIDAFNSGGGLISTTNTILNNNGTDIHGMYVYGKYTSSNPLEIITPYTVPATGYFLSTTYTAYGSSSLTQMYADGMKIVSTGKPTSELTAAGLRMFDENGLTTVSLSSGGKDVFTVSQYPGGTQVNTAKISSDGTVSGVVGAFGSITLDGMDLESQLIDTGPKGVIARAVFTGLSTSTTGSGTNLAKILDMSVEVVAGRSYRITTSPTWIVGVSGTLSFGGLRVYYTTNGLTPNPAALDPVIAATGTDTFPITNQQVSISIDGMYHADFSGTLKLGLYVFAGGTYVARINTNGQPGYDLNMVVEDIGVSPAVSIGTGLRKFTTAWPCLWSGTYSQAGTIMNDSGFTGYQGYYDSTYDRRAAMFGFTGVAATSGETGKTMAQALSSSSGNSSVSIEKAEIFLHNVDWAGKSSGTAYIAVHNNPTALRPATFSYNSAFVHQYVKTWATNVGKWVTLGVPLQSWNPDTPLAVDRSNGIVLHVLSNDPQYVGRFYGSNGGKYRPQLRLTYTKV
jgi:hypothetical protein